MARLSLTSLCEKSRYIDLLEAVIFRLGGVKILRLGYDDDCYSGNVLIHCELENGNIFVYEYSYGSCPGCDTWEHKELSDSEIMDTMQEDATIFTPSDYKIYVDKIKKENPNDEYIYDYQHIFAGKDGALKRINKKF